MTYLARRHRQTVAADARSTVRRNGASAKRRIASDEDGEEGADGVATQPPQKRTRDEADEVEDRRRPAGPQAKRKRSTDDAQDPADMNGDGEDLLIDLCSASDRHVRRRQLKLKVFCLSMSTSRCY